MNYTGWLEFFSTGNIDKYNGENTCNEQSFFSKHII